MTTLTERAANRIAVPASPAGETTQQKAARYTWAGLRLATGWIFLWAFVDKVFGFGFATPEARAWINGGQPTKGFLSNATGPFEDFYRSIAGAAWADWLFMAGLAGVGIALVLGVGTRIAAAAGGLLLVLMWTASLPLDNNPFMDDHLIYAGLLVGLAVVGAGDTLGFGKAWGRIPLVRRAPCSSRDDSPARSPGRRGARRPVRVPPAATGALRPSRSAGTMAGDG
jgi:thiosulfate dehydrogenase (quinone) large subunit